MEHSASAATVGATSGGESGDLPNAFTVTKFTGSPGLRVEGEVSGDAMQTVNDTDRKMEFPMIVIEPDSSGVFELTRRPAPDLEN